MVRKLYPLFIALIFSSNIFAQSNLFIDTSFTAEQMVMDFFDNTCVTPSNIVHTVSERKYIAC